MSADDFQTKYASVMEGMVKSAIAETTKLFETMVNELKAEITKIKKDNEALVTRCSQLENEKSQLTTYTRESPPRPGTSDGFERRDTAVQCDFAPFRTLLMEQCQHTRHSSLQSHKEPCGYEELVHGILKDHDYESHEEGNSQMTAILVKPEQEEAEPSIVCREVMSDDADSPPTHSCGTETDGPLIDQECSNREAQKYEGTEVAMELPCFGMDNPLHCPQNQPPELGHSPVLSLAGVKDDVKEASVFGQKSSEIDTQRELRTNVEETVVEPHEKEKLLVSDMSENEQTYVTVQYTGVLPAEELLAEYMLLNNEVACEELRSGSTELETNSKPGLAASKRRRQPLKKVKDMQKLVTNTSQLPLINVPTDQEVNNPPSMREDEDSSTVDTVNTTSSEVPQAPKETLSIIIPSVEKRAHTTLEDIEESKVGRLLVSVVSLRTRCSYKMDKPSEPEQLHMDLEEGTIQATCTEASSAVKPFNTPSAESSQAPSWRPRGHSTTVTLQDAMLLVEAMNQSSVDDTLSSQQRKTPLQAQCAPHVVTSNSVEQVPAQLGSLVLPSPTPTVPIVINEVAEDVPITAPSKMTQSTVRTLCGASQITDLVTPQQPHAVTSSKAITSSPPSITAATQIIGPVQQTSSQPPITLAVPSKPLVNPVSNRIIVVPRIPHTISPLSPTQISTVVSTVAAAQNKSSLPASTTAGLPPLPTPSSVRHRRIYVSPRKSHPVVTSPKTIGLADQQSRTRPYPKLTIIIPRRFSALASNKLLSQTIGPTTKQESDGSSPTVGVSSLQPVSSLQRIIICKDKPIASDEVMTPLSAGLMPIALSPVSSPESFGSFQQISISNDTTLSLHEVATPSPALMPIMSPVELPTVEQKISAVVKLLRLPFPVSTEKTVMVSKLPTNGSGSSEGAVEEESSSVVNLTQPSKQTVSLSEVPALSSSFCPNLKEISIAASDNAPEMSESLSLSPETCTIVEEAHVNGCMQPFTSDVSVPVLEKLTIAIRTPEVLAVSDTASEPTCTMDEEMINNALQDCALSYERSIQDKQSAPIQLTPIAAKDISDPHVQMSQTQFLAQLAVSPAIPDHQKASTDNFGASQASCTETKTSDEKPLQTDSLVARLRSHLKTCLHARRTKITPKRLMETESIPVSPKTPRVEYVSPNERDTAGETVSFQPIELEVVKNVTSLKNATNTDPISPRKTGVCKDAVILKSVVKEPTVSWKGAKLSLKSPSTNTIESNPVNPRRSRLDIDGVDPGHAKSTSVSPRRSSSATESANPKKTRATSLILRRSMSTKDGNSSVMAKFPPVSSTRSPSNKDGASPKNSKDTTLRPRRASSTKDTTASMKVKFSPGSLRRTNSSKRSNSPKNANTTVSPSSTKQNENHKNSQSTPLSLRVVASGRHLATPRKTSPRTCKSTTDHATPKKTKCVPGATNKCSLIKHGSTPEMSANESTSVSLRRYSITKDASSNKEGKRTYNSLVVRAVSPSTRWPKLVKDCASPRKIRESTPAKKPRLTLEGVKKNLGVVNAMKLAKAAKAKTLAKMKISNQAKFLNGAATTHLSKTRTHCEVLKKCTTKAVWIPPKMLAGRTALLGGKRSLLLPHTVVLPPSVSLNIMPIRATPTVSPLQPLSVIGKRLLKNQCGECGRILSSGAALESHVSLHTGHRPFSCVLCGKSFPDSRGLKRHGRVHRNGRIHICQQCGKGFVYRFGLTKHIQMVHSRIKPFVCQICNKAFFTKRDVEAHIRIHTGEKPFHCHLCEKKFVRRVELNVHLRWHNGEKRHWCPYCGKGFLDYNNLKRHKYIHTGEKPHSCPHCPKHFTQSAHLKKHVKNVHKMQ